MLITNLIKGLPTDVKNKRILRIQEALSFPMGTREMPSHNVIGIVDGIEIYMDKPGKEYFREGNAQNKNDMTPGVGNYYIKYAFKDIWKDLLNVSIHLSEYSYKMLYVLIYRLAYMLDCEIIDNKVRFKPKEEVMEIIKKIQEEVEQKKLKFKVLEFLNFLDLIGWNEDVKYQSSMDFENVKKGRINNILSMLSIPLIFRDFAINVIENKNNLSKINFSELIDIAQDFSRTRGVSPISNVRLIEHLKPYLTKDD